MKSKAVLLALLMLISVPFVTGASAGDSDGDMLLIDYGNGAYGWYDISGLSPDDDTLLSAASAVLNANSIPFSATDDRIVSVNGTENTSVGTQECSWRFFIWDAYYWIYGDTDGNETYSGGTLALTYSPSESIAPVYSPSFRDAWTSYRGDSSYSGVSGSYGPENAASPLEWYIKSNTGGVYSSVLVADGLAYYITGGDFQGTGVNRNPHLYCVDTVNHEIAWSFGYAVSQSVGSSEYELNTPVIVGDMIVITSSNRHVYCLDRFGGEVLAEMVPEGEKSHFAGPFDTYHYKMERGAESISFKGASTAVYDSGALYFITSDGVLRAVSVNRTETSASFEELWRTPETGNGACTVPPTVTTLDGKKTVISGTSDGKIICFDAGTGAKTKTAEINSEEYVICKITPAADGKIILTADDGAMIPRAGFTAAIDLSSGTILWKADVIPYMHGVPTCIGTTVYAYLEPSGPSSQVWDKNGSPIDVVRGYYALSLEDGHVIWANHTDALTRSGMTFCDSRLYCTDYGTTSEWPNGGAVRCIDPDTGSIIWSARLDPGSGIAYSMCAPTVIGGKVYVGNDDGTLYCISDVPGIDRDVTSDINYESQGLTHWSWLLLFSVAAITAVAAVVLYRK